MFLKLLVILKWKLISIQGQELRKTWPVLGFAFLCVWACVTLFSSARVETPLWHPVSPSIDVWVLGSSSQAPVTRAVYLLYSRPAPAPQQLCWQPGETSSSNFSQMLDSCQSPAAQASTSPSAKVTDICTTLGLSIYYSLKEPETKFKMNGNYMVRMEINLSSQR